MSSRQPYAAPAASSIQEAPAVQGAIESVGPAEVLRLAVAHAPCRVVVTRDDGEIVLWCAPGGIVDAGGDVDAVAAMLTDPAGSFRVEAAPTVPAGAPVPVDDFVEAAERAAATWPDVVSRVPDADASVRPVDRLGGPSVVTGAQWRILARIGSRRRVTDLAELLDIGRHASMRVVAELVDAGLVVLATDTPTPSAVASPASDSAAARTLPPPGTDGAALLPPPPHDSWAEAPDAGGAHQAALEAATVDGGWDRGAPEVADSWIDPEPVHVEDDRDWDPDPAPSPTTTDTWGDDAPAPLADDAWPDATLATHTAVAEAFAPSRCEAPPAHDPADAIAASDVAGPVDEPDVGAPSDEAATDASSDDELVNRALLFKFLSSVRD
jgi:hypothetical protein